MRDSERNVAFPLDRRDSERHLATIGESERQPAQIGDREIQV